jgi:ABC-type phosphate/phosphonate transport system substrate-binding protein
MYRTVQFMRACIHVALVVAFVLGAVAIAAAPDTVDLVVCAPGSPGSKDEAQPRMDAFASTVSAKVGTEINAVYEPTEAAGVKRIANAELAIVSLPFFLAHEQDLGLHARLVAVQEGRPARESWQLVAQKGRIERSDQLTGFTIASNAAFAPAFVRGAVQAGLGALPNDVKLEQTTAVLSALRRAANGEQLAVLLDGPQAAALASLPFASKLEVIARSPAWPVGLVVTVDARLSEKAWAPIEAALLGLGTDRSAAPALAAIQLAKFAPLDEKSLASARQAYGRTP